MKNIIQSLLVLAFLMGCSSSQKGTGAKVEDGPNGNSNTKPETSASSIKNNKEEMQKLNTVLYPELRAAIMTKDDSMVERSTAQVLSYDSKDVRALNALGLYHIGKNHYSLAEYILGKALKSDENSYVINNNFGVLYFQQGKNRKGIAFFKRALELKPDYGIAAANLGSYFAAVKDYEKARNLLEIAYKAGIRDLNTINNYGISVMAMGQNADSIFEQGVATPGSDLNILVNYLIYLVEVKKDASKAKSILDKINFVGVSEDRKELVSSLERKLSGLSNK